MTIRRKKLVLEIKLELHSLHINICFQSFKIAFMLEVVFILIEEILKPFLIILFPSTL